MEIYPVSTTIPYSRTITELLQDTGAEANWLKVKAIPKEVKINTDKIFKIYGIGGPSSDTEY